MLQKTFWPKEQHTSCEIAVKDHRRSHGKLAVVLGDITTIAVDAIVNAANPTLLGGGGVDKAIHSAAGPGLLEECRTLGGCTTGKARITRGYNLPAKWVIHTVGPIWHGGIFGEDELLACCYRCCFALAKDHGIKSIAFPSISTGTYGYPVERASQIAVREMDAFLRREKQMEIIAVCFNQKVYGCYLEALEYIDAN